MRFYFVFAGLGFIWLTLVSGCGKGLCAFGGCASIDNGLVLHFDASQYNGSSFPATGCATTQWTDLSGKNNHGTLTNFGACPASGWSGVGTPADPYRLRLDGAGNYVRISDGPDFTLPNAITVAAWVRGLVPGTQDTVISQFDTTNNKRAWLLDSSASGASLMRVFVSNDGTAFGTRKLFISSVAAYDTTWHHVAFSFAEDTLNMYIDGTLDTAVNKVDDDSVASIFQSDQDLAVGAIIAGSGPNRFFNGDVAVVSIWNRELSAAEILSMCELYESRFTGASCG